LKRNDKETVVLSHLPPAAMPSYDGQCTRRDERALNTTSYNNQRKIKQWVELIELFRRWA